MAMGDLLWLQWRRSLILRRVSDESAIPDIEMRLKNRDNYLLAYRMFREGDTTTAGRLLAGELENMGYTLVK